MQDPITEYQVSTAFALGLKGEKNEYLQFFSRISNHNTKYQLSLH